VALVALVPAAARADTTASPPPPALLLSTPYPAVSIGAGKSQTFNIDVRTALRRRVDLAITQTPPGWQATLRGGGFTINGVFGAPDTPPSVQLEVKVPADAAKGAYKVVVKGTSGSLVSILEFDITVAEVVEGAVTLTSDFTTLKAASTATFSYTLTLNNNTPESTTFNLSASGPPGWQVSAQPSSQTQATTIKVDGGATGTISVSGTPPSDVVAGQYPIKVTAEGGGKKADITLTAEVTGSYKVTLTTPSGRLNAKAVAGKGSDLTLTVRNEGSTSIGNVTLSSSPPAGWKVTFSPSTINTIAAGRSQNVVAHITPSGQAVAGDYVLTLTATGQGSTSNADIRVTVQASKLFGIIGLLVIAAAIYVLLRVFRQYGRR
jgi:uncharacterized membrane protein